MFAVCESCVLAEPRCWARAEGLGVLCEHARRNHAGYIALIRERSAPSYVPPPPPEPGPAPPQPAPLPECPDRGPVIDAAGCLTFKCDRHIRIVSGCECVRCHAAGFAYVG